MSDGDEKKSLTHPVSKQSGFKVNLVFVVVAVSVDKYKIVVLGSHGEDAGGFCFDKGDPSDTVRFCFGRMLFVG